MCKIVSFFLLIVIYNNKCKIFTYYDYRYYDIKVLNIYYKINYFKKLYFAYNIQLYFI